MLNVKLKRAPWLDKKEWKFKQNSTFYENLFEGNCINVSVV